MTSQTIHAGLSCLGCRFCELHTDDNDRNVPACVNPTVAASGMPDDVTICFVSDEVEALNYE